MNDIHAIIAAAKRAEVHGTPTDEEAEAVSTLFTHAIAMAEALARIADEPSNEEDTAEYMRDIARECLDRIVKEAKP